MGKFTKSKNVPAFLKQPNYYAKHEKFDDEIEESVDDCQTCGNSKYMEPTQEHMVKSFDRFLIEKKGIDLTGDNKVDSEDWKAARDIAIKASKAKKKSKKGKVSLSESYDANHIEEGHTCRDGKKLMLSEAAHYLIESVCESIMEDAMNYANTSGTFENYMEECGKYMESRLYEMVDDGFHTKMNENWANESACSESTKAHLDEMCEAICHEALRIHNDATPREFNEYVTEGIGCYRNGMMECGGYKMNEELESSVDDEELKRKFIKMCNDQNFLKLSQDQQAARLGISLDQLIKLSNSIKL